MSTSLQQLIAETLTVGPPEEYLQVPETGVEADPEDEYADIEALDRDLLLKEASATPQVNKKRTRRSKK